MEGDSSQGTSRRLGNIDDARLLLRALLLEPFRTKAVELVECRLAPEDACCKPGAAPALTRLRAPATGLAGTLNSRAPAR